ncbi:MAG: biotin/lipoyl-containing protein [Chloroflexota bacterium]
MKITFDEIIIDLTPQGKSFRATIEDQTFEVEIVRADAERGRLDLRLIRLSDSQSVPESVFTAYVSSDGAKRWVTINGQTVVLTKSSGVQRKGSGQDHGSGLAAPMPGLVRSVNVVEDEPVVKGQTLMLLEAMKMEIRIQAKSDGVVKKLLVKQGQTVERDQVLIEIE